jgi:hypothetical protein
LDDFYASLVSQIGLDVETATDEAEQQRRFPNSMAITGNQSPASLRMKKHSTWCLPTAYEACVKAMTVQQEILETLLDMYRAAHRRNGEKSMRVTQKNDDRQSEILDEPAAGKTLRRHHRGQYRLQVQ